MAGYQVISMQQVSGRDAEKGSTSHATVTMRKPDGSEVTDASLGNGPVDAVFKAIQRALGIRVELLKFSVSAVGSGSEAVGEAVVQINNDGCVHEGSARDTDIVVASADAFADVLNQRATFEAAVVAHTV